MISVSTVSLRVASRPTCCSCSAFATIKPCVTLLLSAAAHRMAVALRIFSVDITRRTGHIAANELCCRLISRSKSFKDQRGQHTGIIPLCILRSIRPTFTWGTTPLCSCEPLELRRGNSSPFRRSTSSFTQSIDASIPVETDKGPQFFSRFHQNCPVWIRNLMELLPRRPRSGCRS